MIQYFKKTLNVLFSLSLINSCTSNQSSGAWIPSKDCIKLNNQGAEYLMNYPIEGETGLNKAINFFEQAIKCDSTYVNAYMNLENALDHQRSYDDELKISNKLLIITNNDPSILVTRGMLFEKMNNLDSAKNAYYLAKIGYEKKYNKHPENVNLIKEIILLKALTDGKEEAIKQLDVQIKIHPNLASKLSGEYDFYKDFDKHAFIYGLTSVDNQL